ncbi:hypothetical protein ACN20G_33275 (plasmid) [Streptomyces sp. BI20]|uniref:hypothetical protein n=1 Tax=Streptomyces sp. BI20 TaxID=3403460 RepID=UPI003C77E226
MKPGARVLVRGENGLPLAGREGRPIAFTVTATADSGPDARCRLTSEDPATVALVDGWHPALRLIST